MILSLQNNYLIFCKKKKKNERRQKTILRMTRIEKIEIKKK